MSLLRALFVVSVSLVSMGCGSERGGGGGDDDGDAAAGIFTGPSGGSDNSSGGPTGGPTGGGDGSAAGLCVDTINQHRASIGLGPLERWADAESCSDSEAASDAQTQEPHGAFGQCMESAQNECPGWPGPPEQMIAGCLQMMWDEGPGEDFSAHGHYLNMSNTGFTKVACGFHEGADGSVWSVQNFR
jgi:hypothetical protein